MIAKFNILNVYSEVIRQVIHDTSIGVDHAPVVQRLDNFIRWIRDYPGSKIYFTLIKRCPRFSYTPKLRVCIFACKWGNTEIFAQIETVG